MEGDTNSNLFFLDASSDFIGIATGAPVQRLDMNGNLQLNTQGNKILVKEGANASMGTATLVAGVVTVSNTLVTASSRIFLTPYGAGAGAGTWGPVWSPARVAATSFDISSTLTTDTRTVAWSFIEPAP